MAANQQQRASLAPIFRNLVGGDAAATLLAALDNEEEFRRALSSLAKKLGVGREVKLIKDVTLEQNVMTAENFTPVLSLAGLSESSDLSLSNISKIYRVCPIRMDFAIKPVEYHGCRKLILKIPKPHSE